MSDKLVTSTKKYALIAIIFVALFAIIMWLIYGGIEIRSPIGWQANVKTIHNPVTGFIRVVDADSGETIFYYYDDPLVRPAQIEKNSEDEWRVTFKKRK